MKVNTIDTRPGAPKINFSDRAKSLLASIDGRTQSPTIEVLKTITARQDERKKMLQERQDEADNAKTWKERTTGSNRRSTRAMRAAQRAEKGRGQRTYGRRLHALNKAGFISDQQFAVVRGEVPSTPAMRANVARELTRRLRNDITVQLDDEPKYVLPENADPTSARSQKIKRARQLELERRVAERMDDLGIPLLFS